MTNYYEKKPANLSPLMLLISRHLFIVKRLRINSFLNILFLVFFLTSTKLVGQKIEAKPGFWSLKYYQDDEQIPKQQFLHVIKTDAEAYSFWKKGSTYETLTYPSAILTVGFLAWQIDNMSNDEFEAFPAIGGILSAIAGWIFIDKMTKNRKIAIQTYNQNVSKTSSFKIKPSKNCLGITLVLN